MQEQNFNFYDNTREQAKASIVIEGLSGTGKTGAALLIAKVLSEGDYSKIYALDTENRSMNLYDGATMSDGETVGKFKKYDLLPTTGYKPSFYVGARESAKRNGAKVFINDSVTHAWQRDGGMLDMVSKVEASAQTFRKGWSAWGEPEVIKEKNLLYSTIRDQDIHVISTVRVKEKFEQSLDDKGKSVIKSLGEQQQMMPDLKYEADLVIHMESPGNQNGTQPVFRVVKSRYQIFDKDVTYELNNNTLEALRKYLNEGADVGVLREMQRMEYIHAITEILDSNISKRTSFPILKEQIGCKGIDLADIQLSKVQILYGMLIN